MRNFSHSGAANGGVGSNGIFEARDVISSMTKHPEFFEDILCMVAPQPVSLRPFYERITEILGITDRLDEIDNEIRLITSFTMDQMSPIEYVKNVNVPTYIIQVHDDALTKPSDVQQIFDNVPVNDKKLLWIEGSTRRWDGTDPDLGQLPEFTQKRTPVDDQPVYEFTA